MLCRRQKTLKVDLPYRGSQGPLHLLIDSTGIKVEGEGEWNARKHGGPKRPSPRPLGPVAIPWLDWRKIHIGIDEEPLEIRTAELTSSDLGDAPMLPQLLDQIPPDQEIDSVTAEGAYDTRRCHEAIATRGAAAIIPPRRNAKPWKPDTAGAVARNEALRASRRFGRTVWRRWSGYHRPSRAEIGGGSGNDPGDRLPDAWMHCVKLLGQRLSARDFHRQGAAFQVRVAVLNGLTALGTPATEPVG